jgi:polysaccharide pyruvyl transferase WcaK-like protein
MFKSITLLGSSSGKNAGDAALISGIMDTIDEACAAKLLYEIPTVRPSYILGNYENRVQPVSMLPWALSLKMLGLPTYRSILRTDLTLIFDAILFDRSLYNPLFNYLSTLYLMLPIAKRQGKRLGMFNVGTGPVNTPAGQKMLREVADLMDFITVRDEDSAQILRAIGCKNPHIIVATDAALNVRPCSDERAEQILNSVGLSSAQEILGININRYLDTWAGAGRSSMGRERFLTTYAAALSKVLAELNVPALFVCTQHHDVEITQALMSRVQSPQPLKLLSNVEHNHYEIKGVLGKVALLFGMRLHAVILASSALTPVLGLLYQPKVKYYLKTLGLEACGISFDDFNESALVQHLLKGWERRREIRSQLERVIPVQRGRAKKAATIVAALSRGERIEAALARAGGV